MAFNTPNTEFIVTEIRSYANGKNIDTIVTSNLLDYLINNLNSIIKPIQIEGEYQLTPQELLEILQSIQLKVEKMKRTLNRELKTVEADSVEVKRNVVYRNEILGELESKLQNLTISLSVES